MLFTAVMYEDDNHTAAPCWNRPTARAMVGLVALILGAAAFVWAVPNVDALHSGAGDLSMTLAGLISFRGSAQLQPELHLYQAAYYGGIAAVITGGVLFLAGQRQNRSER